MLELTDVEVTARDAVRARGITLRVAPGEIHLLLGPNGSGKSSVLKALMGHPHYSMSGGSATFGGVVLSNLSVEERARAGLFLSPQHIPRLPGVKLVTFLHKTHSTLSSAPLDIITFYGEVVNTARSLGFDESLVDRELSNGLSGGEQKQMECLQLALLKPTLGLLDEIDSGVDVDRLTSVFRAIRLLSEGGTAFIVVSHHPSVMTHLAPTFVHVMQGGTLKESGDATLGTRVLSVGFA